MGGDQSLSPCLMQVEAQTVHLLHLSTAFVLHVSWGLEVVWVCSPAAQLLGEGCGHAGGGSILPAGHWTWLSLEPGLGMVLPQPSELELRREKRGVYFFVSGTLTVQEALLES